MISRVTRFLAVTLLLALVLYIVLLNRDTLTVTLSPSMRISAMAGVVYIAIFFLGIVCCGSIALIFGIKNYLRERGFVIKDRQRQDFYNTMLKARSLLAAGDLRKAGECWQQILRKDPSRIIARVELSRSLQEAGQVHEALKVLDEARMTDPHNTEVLFRAAELNLALHNKTAAVDNLALILIHHPNPRAAEMARDLSEELQRHKDALEYQTKLESLESARDSWRDIRLRLEYKSMIFESGNDRTVVDANLRNFIRQNPDYAPALQALSELETEVGNIEQAAQLLIRAAKVSGSPGLWLEAARLWLRNNFPDRAVSAARAATRDTRGVNRIRAELDLIALYLSLNMLDEARSALENFNVLAEREAVKLEQEIRRDYLVLRGLCLNRLGEYEQSAEVWQKLCDCDFTVRDSVLEKRVAVNGSAPSPSLSTP